MNSLSHLLLVLVAVSFTAKAAFLIARYKKTGVLAVILAVIIGAAIFFSAKGG